MTTSFDEFLSEIDSFDADAIHSLYNAVESIENWGQFDCSSRPTKNGDQYFVKNINTDETLLLASGKARNHFLQRLDDDVENKHGLTVEGWYSFQRAMSKND